MFLVKLPNTKLLDQNFIHKTFRPKWANLLTVFMYIKHTSANATVNELSQLHLAC